MPESRLAEVAQLVARTRGNPLTTLARDCERLATLVESLQMQLARSQSELRTVRSDYEFLAKKYERDIAKIVAKT